ncbi:MAG: amino acid ABC transporter permease, partial [Deltaproteobacteria bacterium]|nr:amino acid ABC transporter permease [Deltaproteobacteria bacterium]
VEGARNTPPLVLVFIFYFFVSEQLFPSTGLEAAVRSLSPEVRGVITFLFAPPARLSAFLTAILTLALYEGAYITEIVRAGIQSVERGQWEAARALGLSPWQQVRYVVGPQALARTVPPLAGQFVSTIKDSAIVSVIAIAELTFQGQELMAATFLTFEVWITVLLLYFVLCFSLSLAARKLEAAMSRPSS